MGKINTKTILIKYYSILRKFFFLVLVSIFFFNPASVLADSPSIEESDTGFIGNIVIRQQTKTVGSVSVYGPVAVDLRILDTICRVNIKSINDYARWLQKTVKYKKDNGVDTWSLPEETLTKKHGDCEDIAFLNKAFLHVLGYQPKVMALLKRGGRKGHAICVFKKNGYYLWFDNTKLKKTSIASMEEFAKYILRNGLYAHLFEINFDAVNQTILSAKSIAGVRPRH